MREDNKNKKIEQETINKHMEAFIKKGGKIKYLAIDEESQAAEHKVARELRTGRARLRARSRNRALENHGEEILTMIRGGAAVSEVAKRFGMGSKTLKSFLDAQND